eukprot:TRINITY_DN2179_c0_g1_i11.p2 TRINITY_DN2179_c0_g1~~TRINITY_DN2179_c0_g1_i11.p2  ORF type:complete len:134 (-),score=18.30 TRINITY_DN2179_c0_g1_i11:45-446(-)
MSCQVSVSTDPVAWVWHPEQTSATGPQEVWVCLQVQASKAPEVWVWHQACESQPEGMSVPGPGEWVSLCQASVWKDPAVSGSQQVSGSPSPGRQSAGWEWGPAWASVSVQAWSPGKSSGASRSRGTTGQTRGT